MAFVRNLSPPPPSQDDRYYFQQIGFSLDNYGQNYERFLLAGDFNAEDSEPCLSEFKNLVKSKTCYKNIENPSYIDLFITNYPGCFQSTQGII